MRAAEGATRMLLGTIVEPAPIDRQGWSAWLRIERELPRAPAPGGGDAAAGDEREDLQRVRIAWEELAAGRPARFAAGDRVLVALEPLPGWSIWRRRLPRRDASAVAARGQAFVRDPDAATVEGLARWRALASGDRELAPGAAALAALIARATPPVAGGALERLAEIPGLASRLDAAGAADLAHALADPARPAELRLGLASLAGARRIAPLRPTLVALTGAGPPYAAASWSALADLDGGLEESTLRELLANRDPGVRAVATRFTVGTALEQRSVALVRRDPAPEVRAAAVRALLATRRPDYVDLGFHALSDSAPEVRQEAAQSLAVLGAAVVPRLVEFVATRSGEHAAAALASLALAGPEGQAALRGIAHDHPDEATRNLATLMAGQNLHEH